MYFLVFLAAILPTVGPFIITAIVSEPSTWPHTPDWGLAFGVETAWLGLLAVVCIIVAMVRSQRHPT